MKGLLHQRYIKEAVENLPSRNETIKVSWKSPSNIALVKYWGKAKGQIPRNPSLSFSLKEAVTKTHLIAIPHSKKKYALEYYFEEKKNEAFESRILKYIDSILPFFPFLNGFSLEIRSKNTFPHSSGIASSASSMSALALCICSLEEKMLGRKTEEDFFQKASFISRLGSGSASRSVFGGFVSWGKQEGIDKGSDEIASELQIEIGPSFKDLHDAILIVSPGEKKVSSSQGHSLMDSHPYAAERYKQSMSNHAMLIKALEQDDTQSFIRITENEALTLHGLMLSSDPAFVLLEPSSLEIISRIRKFRQNHEVFIAFTIDAGPNIHLIYSGSDQKIIHQFITEELQQFCHDNKWIDDGMGEGPEELNI